MGEENKKPILEEADYLNEQVNLFIQNKKEYSNTIKEMLNLFENQDIVQSFFISGNFGKQQVDKISDIYNMLQKYDDEVFNNDDSLVLQTKQFLLDNQDIN